MDREFEKVGLYPHNAESYRKVRSAFENGENFVGIVQATGTGKSYQALQLALDNKDKKITYIVPSNSIIEHLESIIANNPNLDRERDFPNLEFRTYQSLVNMSREELKELDTDLLILDEFHHIGAPVWGTRIQQIIDTHENLKIFGMTAYTVRDRGTIYERDIANPDGSELFSNKIVNRYDLVDAMIDGVLPRPIYRSAYIQLFGLQKLLEDKVLSETATKKEYQEYLKILQDVKRRLEQAPGTKELVLNNIKQNGKYIYFCPPGSDLNNIMNEAKTWFSDYNQDDVVFYSSISADGDIGKHSRNCFYHDKTLDGQDAQDKLRIIFVINQYNEGVHSPGVDGVILGRSTESDIVYFEQIGRALSVRGNNPKKHDNYEKLSIEELIKIATSKGIEVNKNLAKEEIINKLIAPVIIDLANNVDFIKELEDNLQDRIKEIQERKDPKSKRIIKLQDFLFDINMENQDLFNILNNLRERLFPNTWEEMYKLATNYYNHHGNLEILQKFKTLNGYEYEENGFNLGSWIAAQRQNYKKGKLSEDKIQKLSLIGMRFNNRINFTDWEKMYELAVKYYDYHGNLKISINFKTLNGYEYDEKGLNLGRWLNRQKQSYKKGYLSEDRIQKLKLIGMNFEMEKYFVDWDQMYDLAQKYYNFHDNLQVPKKFQTLNGYEYDEKGFNLGQWLLTQKKTYKKGKLSEDKIQKLKLIGLNFEKALRDINWKKMYELAKAYYNHHGNLQVPAKFRTLNGYDYDEKGLTIGTWVYTQKQNYKKGILTEDKIQKLTLIGMIWAPKTNIETAIEKLNLLEKYSNIFYKHKDFINRISYQELYSKICFLEENNIPLENNGELSEIFYMSSINMKEKYGHNLEELCLKYYIPATKSKSK